jgi:hypothetical protein
MVIGSAPEIGTKFTTWGKMDEASQEAWFAHVRLDWGPNLVVGYGTLCTPDPVRIDRINKEWNNG